MEIPISEEIKNKLNEKIKGTNFNSIQEYIVYILTQTTSEEDNLEAYTNEEEADIKGVGIRDEEDSKKGNGYTQEEEEDLKKTLDEMGYI
jgi:hypothetical protein